MAGAVLPGMSEWLKNVKIGRILTLTLRGIYFSFSLYSHLLFFHNSFIYNTFSPSLFMYSDKPTFVYSILININTIIPFASTISRHEISPNPSPISPTAAASQQTHGAPGAAYTRRPPSPSNTHHSIPIPTGPGPVRDRAQDPEPKAKGPKVFL